MARKAKIAKGKKQAEMIVQYAERRRVLKRKGDYQGLAKLPKESRPTRYRQRDYIDGRPRGFMRKFGLSRIQFRRLAHQGMIPGVRKASW